MLLSAADATLRALESTLWQLACVLGPAAACALVLHQLERMTSALLVRTFGWRAVLVTGWIGTPIHELSHFAACLFFMHEVEEVKLFAPDLETGTLGVVRHRAPRGNPWAAIGRFFIGIAPLVGGSLALYVGARVLLPSDTLGAMASFEAHALADRGLAHLAFARGWEAAAALLSPAQLASPRFWLFLYFTACVGSHLAPSRDDLRGAARGTIAIVALLIVVNLVAPLFGATDPLALGRVAAWTAPIVALLVLAVLLCSLVLVSVFVLTFVVERWRGDPGSPIGRLVRDHWVRLALIAAGAVAFAGAAGVVG